ncbi:hypothetical protein BGL34_00580 [Fructilactobacillus lindneri]|uniref:Competence protein ComGF n=2 Tax=Fructilactobacillus lindneri TaxID=53444 RepID=A0AB33BJN3_9LACO|nr:hypothetical protein [Fructilactobacillus lindneri]POH24623.1 hypothetical protein BHU33_01105 [Fructilactobacillus lindneri DSM 20690 = JCM 11027]ANZ58313.1 hypothetical protein AYR60_06000 [Fructilactobacillus lindneri]ANZ59635.1 hypothetical protein AYR59_06255 [Fructilactobacillus lindneri]POG98581.1 hypothetical protein BGL31_01170 [Fructilactobacillus lindneri]POH03969.1 hypothetical protein BGL32_01110 [Fructilactobacillus lindneri]
MKKLLFKIIRHHKNKRYGFTFLESMTVLCVTSVVLLLLIFGIHIFNQFQINEKLFWNTFDETWNHSLVLARNDNTSVNVAFYPNDEVVFKSFNHGKRYRKTVQMPHGLSVVKRYEMNISEKGYVKPQTVYWKSSNTNERVLQKFQLGWGTYRNEKENL